MLGTPVTHFPKFSDGTNGFIIAVDSDSLFLDEVVGVQFSSELDTDATTTIETETNLLTLQTYLEIATFPDVAWSFSSGILYMFISADYFDYASTTQFLAFGYRSGIPITNMNSTIDVPEKHMELFIKYAIREAAQLLGRQVPPSITKDINDLEIKLST